MCTPPSVYTSASLPSTSRSVTMPSMTSACGQAMARGAMTLRTSTTPAATSGSMGVNSMEFCGFTIVAPRAPSKRATVAPPKPPPTTSTPPRALRSRCAGLPLTGANPSRS